ncbi:hypothetical protein ACOSQ2_008356 [Xanthoceras sorbifolium]
MDQIRNTMMQHEALFKEQVQALHKLYDIQILAMQEIRRTCSQARVLTFSSERVLLKDDPSYCSILEGKPLRPAYASGQAYKEEYLALSLHPFVALGDFISSGSFLMDGVGNENFCTAERKPMRNFDLEKLPEEFMDEPEIHVRSYNSEMADAKSTQSQRTTDTGVISVVGAKPFVTSEQINLNCDQAPEDRTFEIDVKKCVTSSLESNSTTEKNASKEPAWKHSPTHGHMEKPTLLPQGSSNLMTGSEAVNFKEARLDRVPDLDKGSSCQGSPEKHQDVAFDSTITSSPKFEQSNCYNSGDSLPKNPTICYQGSEISDSLHAEPKVIDEGKNDYQNDLSDGSNSVLYQDTTSCKNENTSAYVEDSEEDWKSLDGGEAVESECQELPHFNLESTTGDATCKPSVHEECESVAAEILLSFAPSRKRFDSQFHRTQAKADDSSKCCRDNDSNRNLYRTKYPNCSQAGVTNESITWIKSVSRRRTSRRQR